MATTRPALCSSRCWPLSPPSSLGYSLACLCLAAVKCERDEVHEFKHLRSQPIPMMMETMPCNPQASKEDPEQPRIASILDPFVPSTTPVDVCVVGCGPAGLALAAELGSQGLSVALIGVLPPPGPPLYICQAAGPRVTTYRQCCCASLT